MHNEQKSGKWARGWSGFYDEWKWCLLGIGLVVLPLLLTSVYFQLTKSDPAEAFLGILKTIRVEYNIDDSKKEGVILKQLMDTVSGSKTHTFIDTVITHATNALIVAGILLIFVEHRRMRLIEEQHRIHKTEIATSVFRSMSNLMIPDQIVKQLESLLEYKVIKTNCRYTITFEALPGEILADSIPKGLQCILVRRALRFKALNISSETITHQIRQLIYPSGIEVKKSDGSPAYEHAVLEVGGKNVLGEAKLSSDGKSLVYELRLMPNTPQEVYTVGMEVKLASDTNFYGQLQPVTDLEINIKNKLSGSLRVAAVTVHHPQEQELSVDPDDPGHFIFPRAMLPGQSFSIEWITESPKV